MGGVAYYGGFTIYGREAYAYYNLTGLGFVKMSGIAGTRDGCKVDGTISFYGDNKLLEQIKIKGGRLPVPIELNLSGVKELRMNFSANEICDFGCADVTFE